MASSDSLSQFGSWSGCFQNLINFKLFLAYSVYSIYVQRTPFFGIRDSFHDCSSFQEFTYVTLFKPFTGVNLVLNRNYSSPVTPCSPDDMEHMQLCYLLTRVKIRDLRQQECRRRRRRFGTITTTITTLWIGMYRAWLLHEVVAKLTRT